MGLTAACDSGTVIVPRIVPAALGACLCLPLAAFAQVVPASSSMSTDGGTPSSSPLTLDAAIALARRQAPAVRAAQERADAETAVASASRQWRNPTIDLSIENLGPQALEHDTFVWFTQPLDIGARRSTRIAAAQASRDLFTLEVDARRRDVDLLVVDTYLAVVRARQGMALHVAHEQTLDGVVTLLRRRVGEGVTAEGDLRKLEAEKARATIARVRADLEQQQLALALGVLTGLPHQGLGERLIAPPAPPLSGADVAAAVEMRADVRAAAARLDERRTAAAAERALGSTSFAAMGGYKRTSGFNTGTAGLSVDLPIGIRNTPARLRTEAEVVGATLELEQARSIARMDIARALLAAQVLTAQAARVAADLVEPAVIAQRAALAAFREGAGDALALVDANRVYLDAQREALALRLDAAAASIRARLALGEDPLP
jgi:outer membrane protein, heavy metal efflux system